MILNFQITIELIFSLITVVLAFYGCFIGYFIISNKNIDDQSEFQIIEKKYYLLSMIAILILFSRILNVFFFYLVLVSLIPVIPGAMCPYGVLDASFPMSGFANLLIKMLIPFIYGAWIILDNINKQTRSLDMMESLAKSFVLIMFPFLLLDSILDIIYFGNLKTIVVNCCRSVFNEATSYTPITILGKNTGIIALILVFIISLILVVLQLQKKSKDKNLYFSLFAALLFIPVFWIALQDFIAPLWIFFSKSLYNQELGAPHHCPFCLLKRWWSMVPFVLSMWFGVASIGWQLIIKLVSNQTQESLEIGVSTLSTLKHVSVFSLIAGNAILFLHLLLFALLVLF